VCDGPEDESICPQDCSHQQVPQGDVPPAEEGVYRVTNPTSNARLLVQVIRPQAWDGEALPALLLIPGGTDPGSRFAESPANTAQVIADEGFAVVLFDADGRGYSEGEEEQNGYVHQDGLAAVVEFAAALPEIDEGRFGVASWSFGVTMAAGALARYPDLPLRFLIDWEGPANRDDTGGCGEDHVGHLQGHPCDDEEFWREREASIFALGLQVPYLRLQSERDHAQPDNDHALLMIANATAERYGGHGRAPWTRLNDLRPNTVYGVEAPPPMIPEGTASMEDLVVGYAWELFALEE
jgi:pimeloyl-ACP methyl ester carboxylesterase